MARRRTWPEWWEWELAFSAELPERMVERRFNETDLRAMLADAIDWQPSKEPGRFVIRSQWDGDTWAIPVEPDYEEKRLVVITAYRLE